MRTYLLQKAAYVAARPHLRQVLVIPAASDGVQEGEGVRWYRFSSPRIPTQRPYRLLHDWRAVARVLEHERPDVIEVGSPFLVPWVACRANRRLQAAMVWFYHGNVPRLISQHPGHDSALRALGHDAAWSYVRRVSRLFRVVLVASDFVAADLARAGVTNAVRVPLGVDLELFHPRRRSWREATRREAELPPGPLALYLGRFAREKHLDVLIRAWAEVERRSGARLVLVGDGPSRAWLQALPGAERVVWLPFENDREALADLLAAVDLYVAPGPAETFGLAALEAMASGTPVLSVDSGGVPEQVARSGAGAVYPVGDPGALAEAAARLLQGDLPGLGAKARAYAERDHGWSTVFDRIFEVYRDVLRA